MFADSDNVTNRVLLCEADADALEVASLCVVGPDV